MIILTIANLSVSGRANRGLTGLHAQESSESKAHKVLSFSLWNAFQVSPWCSRLRYVNLKELSTSCSQIWKLFLWKFLRDIQNFKLKSHKEMPKFWRLRKYIEGKVLNKEIKHFKYSLCIQKLSLCKPEYHCCQTPD